MVQVNARTLASTKAAAAALAKRRGTDLSKLVNELLLEAIAADRATSALAAAPAPQANGRRLGDSRPLSRTVLTGECLHPIHQREERTTHDVCLAPGCGATFPRGRR